MFVKGFIFWNPYSENYHISLSCILWFLFVLSVLVLELAPSGWMKWCAPESKTTSMSVTMTTLDRITVAMVKMLEWSAKVHCTYMCTWYNWCTNVPYIPRAMVWQLHVHVHVYLSLSLSLTPLYIVPSLEIRLNGTDRETNLEGRVEVNFNSGGWGTVCDDLWSIEDADVACRMLGFKSAFSFTKRASFGEGTGIIWLDNVRCNGTESSLVECSHNGFANHNCRHSEDAGVVCASELMSLLFFSCTIT